MSGGIEASTADKGSDSIDAEAAEFVSRLISGITKKMKKLNWQKTNRSKQRTKVAAAKLVSVIATRSIKTLAMHERRSREERKKKTFEAMKSFLMERYKKKFDRLRADFTGATPVLPAREVNSSAAVEAIMDVYNEAVQQAGSTATVVTPKPRIRKTAVVGSSAAVEAIMALYHQTVREAASSTAVVATPHVPQEVGSSAAVPTNMNVACDERRSVGKETKKTIQPGFQMNNAEIEANLVDWPLENASDGRCVVAAVANCQATGIIAIIVDH